MIPKPFSLDNNYKINIKNKILILIEIYKIILFILLFISSLVIFIINTCLTTSFFIIYNENFLFKIVKPLLSIFLLFSIMS